MASPHPQQPQKLIDKCYKYPDEAKKAGILPQFSRKIFFEDNFDPYNNINKENAQKLKRYDHLSSM